MVQTAKKRGRPSKKTPMPEPDNGLSIQEIIEKEAFHWKNIDISTDFTQYNFHWDQYKHFNDLKINYKK